MYSKEFAFLAILLGLTLFVWSCGITSETDEEGGCSDGADNDSDGDYDCYDSDCTDHVDCVAGDDDDTSSSDDDDDDDTSPTDRDGDGFGFPEDCDDGNPWVNPDAPEVCNDRDDNCNGLVDDGIVDADGDSFNQCDDCDDDNAAVNPDAEEICDGEDSDCNGLVFGDELDVDGDGMLGCDCDENLTGENCDCDDTDAGVLPGATEECDPVDDDCDGDILEGFADEDSNGIPDCVEQDRDFDGYQWLDDCDDENSAVFRGPSRNAMASTTTATATQTAIALVK